MNGNVPKYAYGAPQKVDSKGRKLYVILMREPDVHVVGIGSTWEGSGRKNCQGCRALPPGTGRRGRRGPPTPWH